MAEAIAVSHYCQLETLLAPVRHRLGSSLSLVSPHLHFAGGLRWQTVRVKDMD